MTQLISNVLTQPKPTDAVLHQMPKQLTQDVFKGAPEWANFLVVNAYGIGFFTDVSPYLATWRAANGWVQSSYSKGLIAFAGKFDVDDWQKFKLKRLTGSENK